ncbi:mannose-1-phosphate guanylyltransferase/mannose-6-phosphate isomerase [Bacterioplanoides sp. SCSIO 12839]|uniref:mannose-1-phosphate guanylyltransferase/mannose-6-phosphate isomerase n=1 Tax=Bacterioplanoides sp. SCSIO 12839 TaxID=2829569 RepID=UPI0021048818|nr:mannose-1-phosphate guanylyltransferase/mannose-6-phosphate isomerase [Bacterioplanoides sp. SCSIO 12839]UTW49000.1 mannose-1-phosphate guanylyltransferase/mannose-6-phosphate isomerase [Bacterioplanoides sp. SCSIO 12839]
MITPVIMAGGSGTRLWPMSRTAFPKQFLALGKQLTMLQQTTARLDGLHSGKPVVITNEEHRFLVAEQMRQQSLEGDILLEPVGRNTAPAIALAAFQLLKNNPNNVPVMLVLASDHIIQNTEAFQQSVLTLLPDVEAGNFGTLGIVPTEPATGYGYIKRASSDVVADVEQFVEKPDAVTAKTYLENDYLWNSGMFMIRADRYLEELKEYRPDIYQACEKAMMDTSQDLDFTRVNKEAFEACPDESIDYAVMEPLSVTGNVVVTPLNAGWSDVGSWSALWEIGEKCADGNVLLGKDVHQHAILKDTRDSFIFSENRLITTLGVENLVVVDTPDAILIADKDKVQNVKEIVAEIKKQGRTEHYSHREVYRPWGKYDSIDNGERYQVKRITVKPGAKLSVQMHHHRAEHWIVVSGTASVTNGDNTYLVTENESTYIPIGQVHALENPGVIPLEMIEVQSGSYLGEDDIVRLKDKYGRA